MFKIDASVDIIALQARAPNPILRKEAERGGKSSKSIVENTTSKTRRTNRWCLLFNSYFIRRTILVVKRLFKEVFKFLQPLFFDY